MAGKKENIKALFTNVRSRVIIIFTFTILTIAIVIGLFKIGFFNSNSTALNSDVNNTPAIQSIPGALDPTAQYVQLQENQNASQADTALKSGSSAIPTIVRSQSIGTGGVPIGVKEGEAGVGFTTLAMGTDEGSQRSGWIQELTNKSCDKNSINQVMMQGGNLSIVKSACSCIQIKEVGYQLKELQSICSCPELKAAGYNAVQLKAQGYTVERLRECGFSACELRNAGFNARQMLDGGYTPGELRGAGYNPNDIDRANGDNSNQLNSLREAGCDPKALENLRSQGVSTLTIRQANGCSLDQLKNAGFTPAELKNAGFTAADLKKAGFIPTDLKKAGFTPQQMLDAGYTPEDLKGAGYSAGDINQANGLAASKLAALKKAGCDPDALRNLRSQGVSALAVRQSSGCSLDQLEKAGYTPAELKDAGFTAADLKNKGFTPAELKKAGFTAADLKKAGLTAADLKKTGFSPADLKEAGFTPADLKKAGFTPSDLKDAGFTAAELKKAGFTPSGLKEAGFAPADLKKAGYTGSDLMKAGFSPEDLERAGFSPQDIADAKSRLSPAALADNIAEAGCSQSAISSERRAGISAADIRNNAKCTDEQLINGGFTPNQLNNTKSNQTSQTEGELQTSVNGLEPLTKSSVPSTLPSIPSYQSNGNDLTNAQADNARRLQEILARQNQQVENQQYQQKIQDRSALMTSSANQLMQEWKKVSTQVYLKGVEEKDSTEQMNGSESKATQNVVRRKNSNRPSQVTKRAMIKTGDILFAVIDTSVNSDEPGPVLATIVSGKFKGSKLIGSFNLPTNAEKMVISFNTMSVPGAQGSSSISALAIDANTARTALASSADSHFWYRYGSLFASSFLEGLGGAFQSADTQVTVGGTGAGDSITVQNGFNRSLLQNTVIALGDVGKAWGQVAQQNFNTPPTVEVYSGTGIGVLFTQDLTSL